MSTQINQYVSKIQSQKSMRSRVARAARGIPTIGKLPFGRTFDRATETWGIDTEKQKKIAWAADEYLKGKGIREVSEKLGIYPAALWKILTRRSGGTWEVQFQSKRINIDETVTMKIPPLLSPETIRKIHERTEANKTYTHGMKRYEYLLARMSFEEKRKLVSDFFAGKDSQGGRLGIYVEKTPEGNVKYEIRGTFDQTFKGTLTPDGPDILDLPDMNIEHLEDLKEAVKGKGKKGKQENVCRG